MNYKFHAYGGLALAIFTSLVAQGIYETLPSFLKMLVWLIPPATSTQIPAFNWNGENGMDLFIFPFVWIIIYALILLYLFIKLANRVQK